MYPTMGSMFPKIGRLTARSSISRLFGANTPEAAFRVSARLSARGITRAVQSSDQWLAAFDKSRFGPRSKTIFEENQAKGGQRKVPDAFAKVPVIAVENAPIFPKFTKAIEITDPNLIEFVNKQLLANNTFFGVFLKRSRDNKVELITDLNDIHRVGTFVHVKDLKRQNDRATIIVDGIRRIKISKEVPPLNNADWFLGESNNPSILVVDTEKFKSERFQEDDRVKAISQEIVQAIRDIVTLKPLPNELLEQILQQNQSVLNIYL